MNNLSGKTAHKFGHQGNPSSLPFWPELELTNRSYLHLKTVEVVHSTVKTNQLVLSWSKEGRLTKHNGSHQNSKSNTGRKRPQVKAPVQVQKKRPHID